jgi:heat shock protein HtpX
LGGIAIEPLPQNLATAGIAGKASMLALFSSHPPIEARIAALQSGKN